MDNLWTGNLWFLGEEVLDVAIGELIFTLGGHRNFFWNQLDPRGGGLLPGLISSAIFCEPLLAMFVAREKVSR